MVTLGIYMQDRYALLTCLLLSWCEDQGGSGDVTGADSGAFDQGREVDDVGAGVAAVFVAAPHDAASAL